MKLTDLQLKSAEILARVICLGTLPKTQDDLTAALDSENIDKAIEIFEKRKYTNPLTLALIIEGLQHKTFKLLNYRVDANPYKEVSWVIDYLKKRIKWLESKQPQNIYKVKTFIELIQSNNWNLVSPFKVHLSEGQSMSLEVVD